MNNIGDFVRRESGRLSARFEKEKNKEWVKKLRRNNSLQSLKKRRKRNSSKKDEDIEIKHQSAPLMTDTTDHSVPIVNNQINEDDDEGMCCIICVGSTGAGKSKLNYFA